MTTSFKPENYNSVSPYLVVKNAGETIEFLMRVFDAEELRRFPGEGGRLMHAELLIDDTVIMLGDSVEGWPPLRSHVHVYVRDVDRVFQRALDAGATPVQEPRIDEEGDKRGGVEGPGGITWWMTTQTASN